MDLCKERLVTKENTSGLNNPDDLATNFRVKVKQQLHMHIILFIITKTS